MKKLLCLCLAAIMIFSFAGCGKKEASTDGPVTITWYLPGDKQADIASVMDKVNEISEKEIGVKVDVQFIDNSAYGERMKMMMASQTEMDIVFVGYCLRTDEVVKLGGLTDLTDMLPKVAPKLYKELIPDYVWQAAKVDGKIYAVPNIQILCQYSTLGFRKDLLDKYGYDKEELAKSLDKLAEYLQVIKDKEPDYIPMRQMWAYYEENMEGSNGPVYVTKDTGKVVFKALAGGEEFYQRRHDWYERGFFRKDIDTNTDDAAMYKAGKFAVVNCGWAPGVSAELTQTLGTEYVVASPWTPYMHTNTVVATENGISRTSKHPEEALKFLQLVNENDEVYNLLCYGIEGKHYNLDSNDRVEKVENSGYDPNASWKFGNTTHAYLFKYQDADVREKIVEANENAIKSKNLGLVYNTDAIQTELTQVNNTINQYAIGYATKDISGAYKTLVSEIKKAGGDKVVAEYQRQVDEFRKNNK